MYRRFQLTDMSFLVTNLIVPEGTLCAAETGPLSGPERGLLSSIWEWIFQGDTHAAKARHLTGKGCPRSGEPEGNGAQEDCSTGDSRSPVLWWWGHFPGGLWPVILTQGPSWWRLHLSAKVDASEEDSGSWQDVWRHLLTFPKFSQSGVAWEFCVPYQDPLS